MWADSGRLFWGFDWWEVVSGEGETIELHVLTILLIRSDSLLTWSSSQEKTLHVNMVGVTLSQTKKTNTHDFPLIVA